MKFIFSITYLESVPETKQDVEFHIGQMTDLQ